MISETIHLYAWNESKCGFYDVVNAIDDFGVFVVIKFFEICIASRQYLLKTIFD